MFVCRSLLARASRLTRPAIPCAAGSPIRYFHQGPVCRDKLASFVMEGAQGSSSVAKHNKRKSPVQRWRPVSTEAVPQKDETTETSNSGSNKIIEDCIASSENLASDGTTNVFVEVTTNEASSSKNNLSFEYSSTKVVIEDNAEVSGFNKDLAGSNVSGTYSSSIEAVQSRQLDYSHFISLPLALHQDLVDKLNHFQSSILGEEDSDKDESRSEGSIDEMDDDHKQADGSSISIKLQVQEEESAEAKMGSKGSQSDFGIDKSIFIKPKTFHLTVLMLKLWNKDRIAKASDVLQSVSTQVNEALENRPISIQLRGLTCMKGSPAKARVVYAPVLEVGGEGRLARACKVITDAFAKSGLVFQSDVRELKLHATMMNVRHRKSTNKRNQWKDSFDARDIFRKFGKEEWGEYPIHEVHLSQRFKFDKSGYYYRCSSIPLPTETHTE
ncbi:uncharacterized protein [Miscanthus floridulus]|uniref:uncharacterized protein isoform X4 n=1 Tax=Miscanthus floridulus TaxID=154761 RepID=UPI00345968AE